MATLYINRPHYMRLLKSYVDTEPIKILQGIRRCGKSSLVSMLARDLQHSGVPAHNILHKRFDEFGLPLTTTAEDLTADITAMLDESDSSRMRYIFLDEIQEVQDWPKVVRGLHTLNNVDVYLTGSNASLLSTDLATVLAGRTITLDIHPLSFAEYLDFTRAKYPARAELSTDELFADYVRFGGMPTLFALRDFSIEGIARELESVYNTVILRDVAQHLQIRDLALLNRLIAYLFATSGNLFSTRKIVGALVSGGRRTSAETVETYIDGLIRAFIMHEDEQFGLQGKNLLNPLRKFYVEDNGLRNLASKFSSQNYGFQLENIVSNELRLRGFATQVGTFADGEVDFVASRFDERLYIQVTETMLDSTTRERELKPLRALHDSFPKMVLTLDRFRLGTTEDGIKIVNIVDWLLEESLK